MDEELDKLKKENEELKIALKLISDKRERNKRFRWFITKKVGYAIVGRNLKGSIKNFLDELHEKKSVSKDTLADLIANIFWRLTSVGLIAMIFAFLPTVFLVIQTYLLSSQNKRIDIQNDLVAIQNERIKQQAYLQEAERRSALVFLFSNIMDLLDKELKEDYKNDNIRNISPQLIARIVSLSQRLQPYKYLDGDNLTKNSYSPERAQLFINLVKSNLSQETLNKVISECNFTYSYFDGISFSDLFLENVKFDGSLFKNSSFNNVLFKNCEFDKTIFESIVLDSVQFDNSIINKSKFKLDQYPKVSFQNSTIDTSYFIKSMPHVISSNNDQGYYFKLENSVVNESRFPECNCEIIVRDSRIYYTDIFPPFYINYEISNSIIVTKGRILSNNNKRELYGLDTSSNISTSISNLLVDSSAITYISSNLGKKINNDPIIYWGKAQTWAETNEVGLFWWPGVFNEIAFKKNNYKDIYNMIYRHGHMINNPANIKKFLGNLDSDNVEIFFSHIVDAFSVDFSIPLEEMYRIQSEALNAAYFAIEDIKNWDKGLILQLYVHCVSFKLKYFFAKKNLDKGELSTLQVLIDDFHSKSQEKRLFPGYEISSLIKDLIETNFTFSDSPKDEKLEKYNLLINELKIPSNY